ncbi:MAG TPA: Gfo/Idh/MocA family oxidoreductase, partial [Acidimicrobiia bacterium]|nr:Gfo/Idh/MocA family oxidoreductase [Acidimicrobiia bacterium]
MTAPPLVEPSRPVRWGIASTGGIAASFTKDLAFVDDAEVVAVASRARKTARRFAAAHGIPRAHDSYEAMAADPNVDVVYVATPHSRHCADTLLFLAAGKHVLCEKPFALNHAQASSMAADARARGLFLMEAMWSRFLPAYVELRRLVAGGAVGEVVLVEGAFGFAVPFDASHRLFAPELGGGALLDVGVYPVQLAHLLLGTPAGVSAVAAMGATGVD